MVTALVPPLTLQVFGKHPSRDDFISASNAPALNAFDHWLLEGMEWANARVTTAWTEAFARGAARAFVYHESSSSSRARVVAGALQPSCDRFGRQFPLVAAAELDREHLAGQTLEALPVILEPLWQRAAEALAQSVAEALPREPLVVDPTLLELGPLDPSDASAESTADAAGPYRQWTRSLTTAALWQGLFGAEPGERPERALRLLLECVRPVRGVEQPTTWLTLRLPLGSAAGAGICFWLDLTRRIATWRSTVPTFFWCQDAAKPVLLLHLGQAPKSTLSELWLPAPRDEICDLSSAAVLERAPLDATSASPLPESCLTHGDATVDELLQLAVTL